MKTRGLVAVLLLLTGLQSALAQTLKVYLSDKQVVEYSVEKVDSLVFTGGAGDTAETHEWVDLGLPSGTLWATCNVGANSPEEYGDYFAWGETEPKTTYSWSTYKYCKGSETTMTKYCTDSNGTFDNKTELEAIDDAATANWGSEWQMPSKEQRAELINSSYTTTTWTTMNGVKGLKITSKSNGNSIFLPAAGHRKDASLNDAGSYGDYWSRSLDASSNLACSLYFYSGTIYMAYIYRYYGRSVRPVRVIVKNDNSGTLDGHEYVDLGLPSGTLWATCNVGASSPEEYGDYFAWGETTTKIAYSWNTYKYCKGSSDTLTKYDSVDNKSELEAADDAATVNWGIEWQMPSFEQLKELYNYSYTTWTRTTMNGKYGMKITSKSNGNSIFLPAAGLLSVRSLYGAGSDGYYWSRSLYTNTSPYYLDFNFSYIYTEGGSSRRYGQSVRPVRVKN